MEGLYWKSEYVWNYFTGSNILSQKKDRTFFSFAHMFANWFVGSDNVMGLFGIKPLQELVLLYCQLESYTLQWNFNQISMLPFDKMHLKMVAIVLKPQCANMMTSSHGNIFRVTGHLCGEFTGRRWSSRTKASEADLWCFLWSAPEWTIK